MLRASVRGEARRAEASGAGWRRGTVGTWARGASEAGGLGVAGQEVRREVRWRGAAESARQRVLGEREACCWYREPAVFGSKH